MEININDNVIS